jgi:hypothetical protein
MCLFVSLGIVDFQSLPANAAGLKENQNQQTIAATPNDFRTAISRVAQEATPAVVHIQVTQREDMQAAKPDAPLKSTAKHDRMVVLLIGGI